MKRKKLLFLLVLLLTVAQGLWAASMKSTPLTMEVLSPGTIVIDMGEITLTTGMKYRVNSGDKQTITTTTTIENLVVGDKVQFYGNGTNTKVYGGTKPVKISGGTAQVKVYGNIMSLINETGFSSLTKLEVAYTFRKLFENNTKLTDASNLLLPAKKMLRNCYAAMFSGCTNLTATPELPATTMEQYCYSSMFADCSKLAAAPELPATIMAPHCYHGMFYKCASLAAAPALPATTLDIECYRTMFYGCTNLTEAPVLSATTLAEGCYRAMFYQCPKLASVTCLAMDITAADCTSNWLNYSGTDVTDTKTFTLVKGTPWAENSVSGIPTGWTCNLTYAVSLRSGTTDADKWKAKVDNATAKPLPVTGLVGGEQVTLTYSGRLKVKDVTATTDAEP